MSDEQQELGMGELDHPDQEATHEETWSETLPPEDDFHDHDLSDPEIASTHMDESDGQANPFQGKPLEKRSGSNLLIGIIAVFALFIGGMLYLQYGRSGPERQDGALPFSVSDAHKPTSESRAPAPSSDAFEPPVTPTMAEADITSIYNAGLNKTTKPATGAVAMPGSSQPDAGATKPTIPEAKTSEIITSSPIVPAGSSSTGVPSSLIGSNASAQDSPAKGTSDGSIAPSLPNRELTAKSAGQPMTSSISSLDDLKGSPEKEAQIKALTAQVEELKAALQNTTQKVNLLTTRLEGDSTGGNSDRVEGRLNELEQRLAQLAYSKGTKTAAKAKETQAEKGVFVSDAEPAIERPKETVKKSRKVTKKKTIAAKPSPKQKASSWVLRAATPDSAWVAVSTDSPELRQVRVGETLTGIGKIQEIRQENGSWVVVGTSATLR